MYISHNVKLSQFKAHIQPNVCLTDSLRLMHLVTVLLNNISVRAEVMCCLYSLTGTFYIYI